MKNDFNARRSFITLQASDADVQNAISIRESRDQLYKNIYEEQDSDERWVGDLGEILFDRLMEEQGFVYNWYNQLEAAKLPDFSIFGFDSDLKVNKRQALIMPHQVHYGCQISAEQAPYCTSRMFIFGNYCIEKKTLQILGAISKQRFMQIAVLRKKGEWVTPKYQLKHDILDVTVKDLTPINVALKMFKNHYNSVN